jgi:predicted SprT family Zn-dependent metalloprotease
MLTAGQLHIIVGQVLVDNWAKALTMFKDEPRFNLLVARGIPQFAMNNRLTSTAGRAWLEKNSLDFSVYLMQRNLETFKTETIPHELAHQIAFALYLDRGHGWMWKSVMVRLGCTPDRCHEMETKSQAKRAGKKE